VYAWYTQELLDGFCRKFDVEEFYKEIFLTFFILICTILMTPYEDQHVFLHVSQAKLAKYLHWPLDLKTADILIWCFNEDLTMLHSLAYTGACCIITLIDQGSSDHSGTVMRHQNGLCLQIYWHKWNGVIVLFVSFLFWSDVLLLCSSITYFIYKFMFWKIKSDCVEGKENQNVPCHIHNAEIFLHIHRNLHFWQILHLGMM
jgi:hypothetical protein